MLTDRIEHRWLAAFGRVFELCKAGPDDVVALLSETQSRALNVDLARLALQQLDAQVFEVVVPTPPQTAPVPVRSTGASQALNGQKGPLAALKASTMVVDLTVEGPAARTAAPGYTRAPARAC